MKTMLEPLAPWPNACLIPALSDSVPRAAVRSSVRRETSCAAAMLAGSIQESDVLKTQKCRGLRSRDDDFQPITGLRLIRHGMVVHDGQRARLHKSLSLALCDRLPRVAGPRRI